MVQGKLELNGGLSKSGLPKPKKIGRSCMLDVYTDWCGWCKKLDRDVYGDDQVSQIPEREVRRVKLNAEDASNITYKNKTYSKIDFAKSFGVRLPTIIFFESNVMHQLCWGLCRRR